MAYPAYIKEKARELRRRKQLAIDELAQRLALSRTTAYYWVRDIPIPRQSRSEWPESARRKGSIAMQAKYRGLRNAAYEQGRLEFDGLSACPTPTSGSGASPETR